MQNLFALNTLTDSCPLVKTLDSFGLIQAKKGNLAHTISVANSIQKLQNEWDTFVPNSHSLSSANLSLYESVSPKNITYRYAIVYQESKPVFCAAFQVVRIKPENLRNPQKNKFLKCATDLMLNLHEILILVSGNVFKDGSSSLYFRDNELSAKEANDLLAKCIEQIEDKDCIAAIMLKDFPDALVPPNLSKQIKLEDDILMSLEIDPKWNSLNDYITALSKKYAARAKKILNSAAEIEVKELSLEEIGSHQKDLHTLYCQVLSRQSFCFGKLNEDYFTILKSRFGESFSIKGLFLNGKLVAFCSYFLNETKLDVHYVGIDYEFNQTHNLYFYIHFLVLQDAIILKMQTLEMGRTTLEAKAILGCKPHYNNTYISFKNSLAECCYNYFSKNLSESDSWKTRNPLKTIASQELAVVGE